MWAAEVKMQRLNEAAMLKIKLYVKCLHFLVESSSLSMPTQLSIIKSKHSASQFVNCN